MELAKPGWVDVKRNIKKELKDENIVNTTLKEEKMCQARRLNVRVTRLNEGVSPDEDAQTQENVSVHKGPTNHQNLEGQT